MRVVWFLLSFLIDSNSSPLLIIKHDVVANEKHYESHEECLADIPRVVRERPNLEKYDEGFVCLQGILRPGEK